MSKSIDVLASEWALKNADDTLATNSALNRGYKAGYKQRNDELIDLLVELEDYFDNKSDADGSSEGYTISEEMRLLVKIIEALEKCV